MDRREGLADLARLGRVIDGALWAVTGLVLVFTCVNVTLFAEHHGVWLPIAILLDPMVSLALVVVLLGDGRLAPFGIRPTGWGVVLRWFAALATWAMNVWESVFPYHHLAGQHGDLLARVDIAGVVLHSVPPALLIVLTEAAAGYRRRIADAVATATARQAGSAAAAPPVAPGPQAAGVVRDVPAPHPVTDTGTGREWTPTVVSLPTGSAATGSGSRTGSASRGGSARAGSGSGSGSGSARATGSTRARTTGSAVTPVSNSRPIRRDGEPTPTELARAHWETERAAGRTPTGAELDRVAGTKDFGRQLRRKWLAEEPIEADQDAQDGAQGLSSAQTQVAGGAQ